MRFAIGIEYDGSAYNGWQRQQNGVGVQPLVESALTEVADELVEVFCAGRTDAGVHALGQVAHFDTNNTRDERSWLLGANSNLPDDISVIWARRVPDDFHARYSAVARSYRYCILNRAVRSALYRNRAWYVHRPLDAKRMHSGAQLFLGEHDFSAFRAAGCQASTPRRTISAISVTRNENWLTLAITANAFLQHMVRNICGTLLAIGLGEQAVEWAAEVLADKDRTKAGVAAPPHGLTLIRVDYPPEFKLPIDQWQCNSEAPNIPQ